MDWENIERKQMEHMRGNLIHQKNKLRLVSTSSIKREKKYRGRNNKRYNRRKVPKVERRHFFFLDYTESFRAEKDGYLKSYA